MTDPINRVSMSDAESFGRIVNSQVNSIDEYQRLATTSAVYPGQGTPFGLMYAALGLAEAGEVQNKVKKIFRDDGVIEFKESGLGIYDCFFSPVSDERKMQVAKEIGGLLWYAAACCNEIGMDLSTVAAMNLKELAGRAMRGTLGGSGDDR